MKKLDQKVAVILGGTGDIGIETAKLFAAAGAKVIITGRDQTRIDERLKLIGDKAYGEKVDPNDEADLKRMFEKIGKFDFLVNVLGTQAQALVFAQLTDADFQKALNEKLFFYTRSLRAALPYVKESVTWLSGSASRAALPGLSNYAATCGAVDGMLPGLAMELAPIRINIVSSGIVRTDFWTKIGIDHAAQATMYADAAKSLPVGIVPGPAPIGEALFFLATNIYTTGAILDTSGGAVLGKSLASQNGAAFGGSDSRIKS